MCSFLTVTIHLGLARTVLDFIGCPGVPASWCKLKQKSQIRCFRQRQKLLPLAQPGLAPAEQRLEAGQGEVGCVGHRFSCLGWGLARLEESAEAEAWALTQRELGWSHATGSFVPCCCGCCQGLGYVW